MNKKIVTISIGAIGGYLLEKKLNTPKNFKGRLIIDHSDEIPDIYLEQLDKSVINETNPIILNVVHVKNTQKHLRN